VIRFASLGSGSKGNATVIETGTSRILLDCGFYLRDAEGRLRRLGVDPPSLDAIVVSHEHNEHRRRGRLRPKHAVPV
jgi:phosphoribosyl 1,2-cyclic phosphodiesterase